MTEKEISEIRRRFRPDKGNFSRIRGCLVNEKKEIVAGFNKTAGLTDKFEVNEILAIMRKTLTGTQGKNLLDLEFTNEQVMGSDEHSLMMALRDSALTDEGAVEEFYNRVAQSVEMESKYLILLTTDTYDTFSYGKDGAREEDSTGVFSYFVCSVCPLKETKPHLAYAAYENAFHSIAPDCVVGAPELGFMFPCFDDRTANIYNILFYSGNSARPVDDFTENVFKCTPPAPADEQSDNFKSILSEAVQEECGINVVQALQDHISGMIDKYKEANEEQPLKISKKNVREALEYSHVGEERIAAFEEKFDECFGSNAEIAPCNVVDTKRFEVRTPEVSIKVSPERSDLIKTKIIDGTKYILIKAEDGVEVNGVGISIT